MVRLKLRIGKGRKSIGNTKPKLPPNSNKSTPSRTKIITTISPFNNLEAKYRTQGEKVRKNQNPKVPKDPKSKEGRRREKLMK